MRTAYRSRKLDPSHDRNSGAMPSISACRSICLCRPRPPKLANKQVPAGPPQFGPGRWEAKERSIHRRRSIGPRPPGVRMRNGKRGERRSGASCRRSHGPPSTELQRPPHPALHWHGPWNRPGNKMKGGRRGVRVWRSHRKPDPQQPAIRRRREPACVRLLRYDHADTKRPRIVAAARKSLQPAPREAVVPQS